MVQLGFRKPNNKMAQGGALGVEYLKIGANATAAKCFAGIAVIKDTNDFSVKEFGGSGSTIGVLGYDETPAQFRPETPTTAYAKGDIAAVHVGAGRRQKMWLTTSQTIVKGAPLMVTTDGYLTAATPGTHDVYCDADESVTTTSAAAAIWVITRK